MKNIQLKNSHFIVCMMLEKKTIAFESLSVGFESSFAVFSFWYSSLVSLSNQFQSQLVLVNLLYVLCSYGVLKYSIITVTFHIRYMYIHTMDACLIPSYYCVVLNSSNRKGSCCCNCSFNCVELLILLFYSYYYYVYLLTRDTLLPRVRSTHDVYACGCVCVSIRYAAYVRCWTLTGFSDLMDGTVRRIKHRKGKYLYLNWRQLNY